MNKEQQQSISLIRNKLTSAVPRFNIPNEQVAESLIDHLDLNFDDKYLETMAEAYCRDHRGNGQRFITRRLVGYEVNDPLEDVTYDYYLENNLPMLYVGHDLYKGVQLAMGIQTAAEMALQDRYSAFLLIARNADRELGDRDGYGFQDIAKLSTEWSKALRDDLTGFKLLDTAVEFASQEAGRLIPEFFIAGAKLASDVYRRAYSYVGEFMSQNDE